MNKLKIELGINKWLLTGQVKYLWWESKTFKEIIGLCDVTDLMMSDPMESIFYDKFKRDTDEQKKEYEDLLNCNVFIVNYYDVDADAYQKLITSFSIFVVNDDGKTTERIN